MSVVSMSVVSIASVRSLPAPELDQVGQLAVTLSAQLTRVPSTDIEPAIAVALQHVAAATKADICQLVEFSESGTVVRIYAPTPGAGTGDLQLPAPLSQEWLVPQLIRGDVVSISRPDDLPLKALASSDRKSTR